MPEKITKNMTVGEVIGKYPETAKVMMEHGMHCCGCHIAGMETIEQGAESHGIDLKKLLNDMNRAVKK